METNPGYIQRNILLILLLFFWLPLFSQKQFLEMDKSYPVAKIYEKGKPAVTVNNLVLTADTVLKYNLSGNSSVSGSQTRNINNIRYIGVKTGTHAGIYGVYGAASGLVGSVIGVLQVKADPTLDDSGVDWAPFILGFTAGGAVIGAVVGLCVPRWKMLYIPEKSTACSVVLTPLSNRNFTGLGIRVSF